MDSARFDDLLRSFALGFSRRATIGAALSGLFASGSLAVLRDDAEAKKKHKKKKKKKCKGGTKKCGKKCIPSTGCCSTSECGNGGACVNGTCNCLSGFKSCNGACIADDQCCGGCPGDQTCDGGSCICGGGGLACPDGSCVSGFDCCTDEECGVGQVCDDGTCLCTGANDINCGAECCEAPAEVCDASTFGEFVCQGGGCPETDYCNDPELFICANDLEQRCACTTTVDPSPQNACVIEDSLVNPASCAPCANSAGCGAGQVCIPGDASPAGFCGCDNNFCVPLCGEGVDRHAAQSVSRGRADRGAPNHRVDKRRGHK